MTKISCLILMVVGLAVVSAELNHDQKHHCEQYTSIFENDTTDLQYAYCENIGDGRGYTSGRAGFCTGTGDAVVVVRKYTHQKANNPLAKFLPELEKLAKSGSDSVAHLHGYPEAWKEAAKDAAFRKVQDEVSDEMYYRPAMAFGKKANVKTPLGLCAFYDAIIQHGDGDDQDSIGAIIKRTEQEMGGPVKNNEHQWIQHFLAKRRQDLVHPHNKDTEDEWKDSVDRVDAMTELIHKNNWDMKPPMHIKTKNHDKTIH